MKCGSLCALSSLASRGLPNSYIGGMTKISTAIGGIIRTLADKVHTPMASRSLAVPTGRRDFKPVETESSTFASLEYLNRIPYVKASSVGEAGSLIALA